MSRFDSEPIEVNIGACDCPGGPHADGDLVYLAPRLSMAGGMAAQAILQQGIEDPVRLQELLADLWVRYGVTGWNFVDEHGNPVPVTPATVAAALPYGKGGRLVAERADDLYAEDILAPLVERHAKLSNSGPTVVSTSATRRSTKKRR